MPPKRTPAPYFRQRAANPNWRGGRSIASNGYVLIKVGPDHPLVNANGYAYEHRVVASQMIGRPLRKGEQIHHRNGDKTDNRPENLEVLGSMAEHQLRHRDAGSKLRLPGEDNPEVVCACGCGATFLKFDSQGRPRDYVSGHNPMPSPTVDAILASLATGARSRRAIIKATGLTARKVAAALSKLKREGRVVQVRRGHWSKAGD